MQFKTFMLPANGDDRTENDLNLFLRVHKIINVHQQFVADVEPKWCILVEYIPLANEIVKDKTIPSKKIDYKTVLTEPQFVVFSKLREMRKTLSLEESIPPFVIYTDEQLAEIAKLNPKSLSVLGSISGIGQGKLEKYGKVTLETLTALQISAENVIQNDNTIPV